MQLMRLARHLGNVFFFCCPSDGNQVAHLVLRYAASSTSFSGIFVSSNLEDYRKSWIANFPNWVHDVIF